MGGVVSPRRCTPRAQVTGTEGGRYGESILEGGASGDVLDLALQGGQVWDLLLEDHIGGAQGGEVGAEDSEAGGPGPGDQVGQGCRRYSTWVVWPELVWKVGQEIYTMHSPWP